MSNQEAIALLRNLEDSLDSYCGLNEEGKTAFRMAIEALNSSEIPNSSDTISRQAALDAMAELHARATTKAEYKGISKAWKRIKQLPSALGANLAEVGTDTISRQTAIDDENSTYNI